MGLFDDIIGSGAFSDIPGGLDSLPDGIIDLIKQIEHTSISKKQDQISKDKEIISKDKTNINNNITALNKSKEKLQKDQDAYYKLIGWNWPPKDIKDLSRVPNKYCGGTNTSDKANVCRKYHDYLVSADIDKTNALKLIQNTVDKLTALVNSYKSALIYSKKMTELLDVRLNEHRGLEKALADLHDSTITNDRRIYYEENERENLLDNRHILYFFYYGIFIFLFIFGNNPLFGKYNYRQPRFWFIICVNLFYLTFPYWVDYLVQKLYWLSNLFQYIFKKNVPHDVYTNI